MNPPKKPARVPVGKRTSGYVTKKRNNKYVVLFHANKRRFSGTSIISSTIYIHRRNLMSKKKTFTSYGRSTGRVFGYCRDYDVRRNILFILAKLSTIVDRSTRGTYRFAANRGLSTCVRRNYYTRASRKHIAAHARKHAPHMWRRVRYERL